VVTGELGRQLGVLSIRYPQPAQPALAARRSGFFFFFMSFLFLFFPFSFLLRAMGFGDGLSFFWPP